jgi:hypothetical protein
MLLVAAWRRLLIAGAAVAGLWAAVLGCTLDAVDDPAQPGCGWHRRRLF